MVEVEELSDPLDECILSAKSEDEVQACLAVADESAAETDAADGPMDELDICILDAKSEVRLPAA